MQDLKPILQEGEQRTGISLATDRSKLFWFCQIKQTKQNETNKKIKILWNVKGFLFSLEMYDLQENSSFMKIALWEYWCI